MALLGAALRASPAAAYGDLVDLAVEAECAPDTRLPAREYVERMTTGWRPLAEAREGRHGVVNERHNALVIYEVFKEAGYSDAIAMAAIVNAWAESALDNTAVMDQPFWYGGKHYPNGSGAIGLFQLLPSQFGGGGPTGPEEGYSREFQGRRYAGNPWQARHHGEIPDAAGRTYYDATDPRVNTERIVLEVERDGARLLAAEARGASIAELSDIFGRDIERPQNSTRYRRALAADLFGHDIAYARNPASMFLPEPDPVEVAIASMGFTCPDHTPGPSARPEPAPSRVMAGIPLLAGLLALLASAWLGAVHRRASR